MNENKSMFSYLHTKVSKVVINPNLAGSKLIAANGDLAEVLGDYIVGNPDKHFDLKDSMANLLVAVTRIAVMIELDMQNVPYVHKYLTKESRKALPYITASEITRAVATIITNPEQVERSIAVIPKWIATLCDQLEIDFEEVIKLAEELA